jgi:two-component system heavy metal sensor histidine kinase CusS
MFVKPLYFKVALWYALALAFIIAIFGALIYQNFKGSLYGDLDNLLASRADNIEDLIESSLKSVPLSSPAFQQAIRSIVEEEKEDIPFVQVFDAQAHILAFSNHELANNIPTPIINNALLKGYPRIQTLKKVMVQGRQASLRVLTVPIIKDSRLAYIIQVEGYLTPVLILLHKLKTILYLFLPLAVLFAVAIGSFFTKMALDPINKISQTMGQINSKNLQERIKLSSSDREIRSLADTFNDMLSRLEKSFLVQKQFIQDISHELKTPLTAMRGKQEVALTRPRSTEEYRSVLEVNLEEIQKMNRLVEDLLVLISIDNKEALLKMTRIDLTRAVSQAVNNMAALMEQKQIKLSSALQPDLFIAGNSNQISRVVTNLLDNAIKYSPPKGQIDIKLSQESGFARLTIANTGPGIDKSDLPHVFDRFYRADKSRHTSGFGLGLSIVKSVIDAHHGDIRVESQPGQSTSFTVSFPLSISQD